MHIRGDGKKPGKQAGQYFKGLQMLPVNPGFMYAYKGRKTTNEESYKFLYKSACFLFWSVYYYHINTKHRSLTTWLASSNDRNCLSDKTKKSF